MGRRDNLRMLKTLHSRDLRAISTYIRIVLQKRNRLLSKDDWIEIGSEITKNRKFAYLKAKKLIGDNMEQINTAIMALLAKSGIDKDRGLKLLLDAEEIAKKKENTSDMIKIADRYNELHGLKTATRVSIEEKRTIDYSKLLPEGETGSLSINKNVVFGTIDAAIEKKKLNKQE